MASRVESDDATASVDAPGCPCGGTAAWSSFGGWSVVRARPSGICGSTACEGSSSVGIVIVIVGGHGSSRGDRHRLWPAGIIVACCTTSATHTTGAGAWNGEPCRCTVITSTTDAFWNGGGNSATAAAADALAGDWGSSGPCGHASATTGCVVRGKRKVRWRAPVRRGTNTSCQGFPPNQSTYASANILSFP